ncbi:MAG: gamma-glutamyl-gamma-aminobutyrate hydrolase family protein [Bacilli bacterium]|nr:gamma-glutamyl-gamma-aminobutyrate hydrolase family protein [Bacilli bacterium]
MNKIIGIIGRPDKNITNKDVFIIGEELKDTILDFNCIPLGIIPNVKNINRKLNKKEIFEFENILKMCSGFILQGGSEYYDYDRIVIKYAIKNDIPILGICLGCQVMASLYEDNLNIIDTNIFNNHNIKNEYVHDIIIDKNSKLYKIIGKEKIKVNSTHSEHIIDPGIYRVSSFSGDGIIESIEYPNNKFNIGVQFHPERLTKDENIYKIFKCFFEFIKNN